MKGSELGGALSRFRASTYVLDYLGLVLIFGFDMLLQIFAEPFHRMFSLDNRAIQFPHANPERVSALMLVVYAGLVPLAVLTLWAALARPSSQKAHVTFLSLFISVFLTIFITDIIKNTVGRPRPDLLSRCKPAKDTPEHQLVTFSVCTETAHHLLHDGWRSFPSGHSSFSFSGLGFITIFFAGQLHTFHPRTPLPALLITLCPFLMALLIAISRCEDYRHDVWDVTAGSLLGLSIAYLTYRRFYPGLTSIRSETPYAPVEEARRGYMRPRDEEARVGSLASSPTTAAARGARGDMYDENGIEEGIGSELRSHD